MKSLNGESSDTLINLNMTFFKNKLLKEMYK